MILQTFESERHGRKFQGAVSSSPAQVKRHLCTFAQNKFIVYILCIIFVSVILNQDYLALTGGSASPKGEMYAM